MRESKKGGRHLQRCQSSAIHYLVLTRLDNGVCPGCERALDLKNPMIDFCPHCAIHLLQGCGGCDTRNGSFAHFCHACGATAAIF